MTHGPIAVGGRLCGQTLPALPAAIVSTELQQRILPMHAMGHDFAEENRALYKTPYSGKRPDRRRERIVADSYKGMSGLAR